MWKDNLYLTDRKWRGGKGDGFQHSSTITQKEKEFVWLQTESSSDCSTALFHIIPILLLLACIL